MHILLTDLKYFSIRSALTWGGGGGGGGAV
jgi:hypothetical protein